MYHNSLFAKIAVGRLSGTKTAKYGELFTGGCGVAVAIGAGGAGGTRGPELSGVKVASAEKGGVVVAKPGPNGGVVVGKPEALVGNGFAKGGVLVGRANATPAGGVSVARTWRGGGSLPSETPSPLIKMRNGIGTFLGFMTAT